MENKEEKRGRKEKIREEREKKRKTKREKSVRTRVKQKSLHFCSGEWRHCQETTTHKRNQREGGNGHPPDLHSLTWKTVLNFRVLPIGP